MSSAPQPPLEAGDLREAKNLLDCSRQLGEVAVALHHRKSVCRLTSQSPIRLDPILIID